MGLDGARADNNTTLTQINQGFTINPKTMVTIVKPWWLQMNPGFITLTN